MMNEIKDRIVQLIQSYEKQQEINKNLVDYAEQKEITVVRTVPDPKSNLLIRRKAYDAMFDKVIDDLMRIIEEEAGGELTKGDLIYSKDAAKKYSVTNRTLRNWVKAGLLKKYRVNGKIYYKKEDMKKIAHDKHITILK